MKKRFLAVLLLAVLLLPGCGKEKQTTFQVGDKVETYWFQFTVDQVKAATAAPITVAANLKSMVD